LCPLGYAREPVGYVRRVRGQARSYKLRSATYLHGPGQSLDRNPVSPSPWARRSRASLRSATYLHPCRQKITGLGRLFINYNISCVFSGSVLFQHRTRLRNAGRGQFELHRIMTLDELLTRLGA